MPFTFTKLLELQTTLTRSVALPPLTTRSEPLTAARGFAWAEADWLKRFRQLVTGRTALIITHRFSTAMFADQIHVMTGGKIIESGCHEELLRRGGMYAHGWSTQMGTPL